MKFFIILITFIVLAWSQEFNQEQYDIIVNQGVEAWNEYREDHQGLKVRLQGADFGGMDLSGINLYAADLTGANFANCILIDAELLDAKLSYANLSNANLSRSMVARAPLDYANFAGANLTNCNLDKCDIRNTNFAGAIVDGVSFRHTKSLFLGKEVHITLPDKDCN